MSRIVIEANQKTWKAESVYVPVKTTCAPKYSRALTYGLTVSPFFIGHFMGVPQLDYVIFAVVAFFLYGMFSGGKHETYEQEFVRKLKEDIERNNKNGW